MSFIVALCLSCAVGLQSGIAVHVAGPNSSHGNIFDVKLSQQGLGGQRGDVARWLA